MSLQNMAVGSTNSGLTATLRSTDSGSTYTQVVGAPSFAVEYDDGTFACLTDTVPLVSITATSVNSGSTPDEYCLKFRLPFPVRVFGLKVFGACQDTEIGLYPDSGSALATGVPLPASATIGVLRYILFSSPVNLLANTYYRISWKPTSITSRSIPVYTIASAAVREAFDLGLNFALGTRADGGSWTDDETKFIQAGLMVSGADDGSGGGGGSCNYGALTNGTRVVPVAQ
jgi:hypothetical protein